MASAVRRLIQRFSADECGASIIELAAVAPVLAILIVGIGDLSRGYSEKYALQQAANRALETAHLGPSAGDHKKPDAYDFVRQEAANALGIHISNVVLEKSLECTTRPSATSGSVTKTDLDWTDACDDGEEIARYLKLTVNSTFDPTFGSLGYPGARADGTVPISASATLRVQ